MSFGEIFKHLFNVKESSPKDEIFPGKHRKVEVRYLDDMEVGIDRTYSFEAPVEAKVGSVLVDPKSDSRRHPGDIQKVEVVSLKSSWVGRCRKLIWERDVQRD